MRDFLNGLDDLHEYLRFSYPKMCPPSFFCENETPDGMIMHYTTKRRGYLPYVIGQLCAVGKIYMKELKIEILKEDYTNLGVHVVLELNFDNREFYKSRRPSIITESFHLTGSAFISIFPFCIVFDKELTIVTVGTKMDDVLPDLKGRKLDHAFTHRKPRNIILSWNSVSGWEHCHGNCCHGYYPSVYDLLICSFKAITKCVSIFLNIFSPFLQILMHTNCSFELISIDLVMRPHIKGTESPTMQYTDAPPNLRLKGQMMLTPSRDFIMFLCSPV